MLVLSILALSQFIKVQVHLFWLVTYYTIRKKIMLANGRGIIAVTGRAHCQRQVAFFYILYRISVSHRMHWKVYPLPYLLRWAHPHTLPPSAKPPLWQTPSLPPSRPQHNYDITYIFPRTSHNNSYVTSPPLCVLKNVLASIFTVLSDPAPHPLWQTPSPSFQTPPSRPQYNYYDRYFVFSLGYHTTTVMWPVGHRVCWKVYSLPYLLRWAHPHPLPPSLAYPCPPSRPQQNYDILQTPLSGKPLSPSSRP